MKKIVIFNPTHGPQVWPWYKLFSVRIVRCSHDPYWLYWITPIAYNVWFYTRWGAIVWAWYHRRGVRVLTDCAPRACPPRRCSPQDL